MIILASVLILGVAGIFIYAIINADWNSGASLLTILKDWQPLLASFSVAGAAILAYQASLYKVKSDEKTAKIQNSKGVVSDLTKLFQICWNINQRCNELSCIVLDVNEKTVLDRVDNIEKEYTELTEIIVRTAFAMPFRSINFLIDSDLSIKTIRSRLEYLSNMHPGIKVLGGPLGEIQPNTESAKVLIEIIDFLEHISTNAVYVIIDCYPALHEWKGKRYWPWKRKKNVNSFKNGLISSKKYYDEPRRKLKS